jgi:hypothetical protein
MAVIKIVIVIGVKNKNGGTATPTIPSIVHNGQILSKIIQKGSS